MVSCGIACAEDQGMEMEPAEEPEAEFLLMMETTQIRFGGGQMSTGR
jgi:hypothetical protein